MKRTLAIFILAGLTLFGAVDNLHAAEAAKTEKISKSDRIIAEAFENQKSGIQVKGEGTAIKVLADDTEGSKHQRFILKLASGQTLLIAHNIDIAPRVNGLEVGDSIAFYGVYELNKKGGTIHWTHRDPHGRHTDGWLKKGSKKYQ